jgi:hemoglobin
MTPYEAMGGEDAFIRLIDAFYAGVADDPILRPMYPEDLEPAKRHLRLFLTQYFGGPSTYSTERGHPRLRARHVGFPIDVAARDAWLKHMKAAVLTLGLPDAANAELYHYFEGAADFLINR